MAAAETAHLTLDAALFMRARQADPRELRLEQIVRAQRDETIRLHPTATLQHLLDRRGQVVIANQGRHPAQESERLDVSLQERLLVSLRNATANAAPE